VILGVLLTKELDKGKEIDEKELALSCARGDIMARKELYNRYATRLYSLCTRYTQDQEEGKDLLHDTIIKAFDNIGRFNHRGEGSLYAWLRKIAVNLAFDRMRKERRWKFQQLQDDISESEDPDIELTRIIPLPELQRIVSSLPESKRMVFNLFCVDGFSHKEISKLMGISVSTSTSTLAKAKKSLAAMVNEYIEKRM
jgi:RNA polymerase sigma-70 factor (ECF subfamily)